MKKNKFTKSYLAWLKKASEDERTAAWLVESKRGSPSSVCFLSQQMIEKILKGFLVYQGETLKKIHDLLELENLVAQHFQKINDFHEDFKLLNTLYVESRYPGEIEFSWKLAKQSFEAASRIRLSIYDYFEKDGSNED